MSAKQGGRWIARHARGDEETCKSVLEACADNVIGLESDHCGIDREATAIEWLGGKYFEHHGHGIHPVEYV